MLVAWFFLKISFGLCLLCDQANAFSHSQEISEQMQGQPVLHIVLYLDFSVGLCCPILCLFSIPYSIMYVFPCLVCVRFDTLFEEKN